MNDDVSSPSLLPSCILAGVGILFVVLAATLPMEEMCAVIGMSAVAVGLVLARLRRQLDENLRSLWAARCRTEV